MSANINEPSINEAEAMRFQEELQNGLVFLHEPRVEKNLKTLSVSISALPVRDVGDGAYESPRCTFSCFGYRNVTYYFLKNNPICISMVIEFQSGGGLVKARMSTVDGNFTDLLDWDEIRLGGLRPKLQTFYLPLDYKTIRDCRDEKIFFHLELVFRCKEKLPGDSCDGIQLNR